MHWGYKTLPEARIYVLKNFTDMDMELSFDYSKDCSVSLCGNTSLAPGGEYRTEPLSADGTASWRT